MSEDNKKPLRNPYLDEYNTKLKTWIQKHELEAKRFVPEMYELLRAAGFKPVAAGDRLTTDLSFIWSERTIQRYKPIQSRHLEKVRQPRDKDKDTSEPYYEAREVLDDLNEKAGTDYYDEGAEYLRNRLDQCDANVTDINEIPTFRNCPMCHAMIVIIKDHLELRKVDDKDKKFLSPQI